MASHFQSMLFAIEFRKQYIDYGLAFVRQLYGVHVERNDGADVGFAGAGIKAGDGFLDLVDRVAHCV